MRNVRRVLVVGVLAAMAGVASGEGKSSGIAELEKAGVKGDEASLVAALKARREGGGYGKEIEELVGRLVSEDESSREEAANRLMKRGIEARGALEQAATGANAELAEAARAVLARLGGPSTTDLILEAMAEKKMGGGVPVLLGRWPGLGKEARELRRRVLAECATAEHVPAMRAALKEGDLDTEHWTAVLTALAKVDGDFDMGLVKAALTSADGERRRAGIYAMYEMSPRRHGAVTAELIGMLGDPTGDLAERAANFLATIGDRAATDALLVQLEKVQGAHGYASRFLEALVKLEGKGALPAIRKLVEKPDSSARGTGLFYLAWIHAPEAADAVMSTLDDKEAGVRSRACMLLARYQDARAVGALGEMVVKDKDIGVRRTAAYALGRIGDAGAIEALAALLKGDGDAQGDVSALGPPGRTEWGVDAALDAKTYWVEARQEALTALRVIGGAKAADVIFEAAQEPQWPKVRGHAMALLAEMGDKRAVGLVLDGLVKGDYFVKSGAVEACRDIDDRRVIEGLSKVAASEEDGKIPMVSHILGGGITGGGYHVKAYVRMRAMERLNERWPAEAKPVLEGRAKDPEAFVVRRAAELLGKVAVQEPSGGGGPNASMRGHPEALGELIASLEKATKGEEARRAATYLGEIGDRAAVEPLLKALDRFWREPQTVGSIAKALGELGDARATEPLVKLLGAYPQVAEGLGLLGDKRAVGALKRVAAGSQMDTEAAKALFKLDRAESVGALCQVLRGFRSNYDRPRVEAVELLAQIPGAEATAGLKFALSDDGSEVRRAARKALAARGVLER